jgi:hypothetical protein
VARDFDGSTEYLSGSAATTDGEGLTLAAWVKPGSIGNFSTRAFLEISDASADEYVQLTFVTRSTGNAWQKLSLKNNGAEIRSSGNPSDNSWSAGNWYHLAGQTVPGSDDISAWWNGGNISTGSTAYNETNWSGNIDTSNIGAHLGSSTSSQHFTGAIAEAAIWSTNLDTAEIAALATGYSPLLIRPANLIFYVPLIRDNDEDIVGGLSLTANGTPTVEAHPRVIYPAPQLWVPAPAAAGGENFQSIAGTLTTAGTQIKQTTTTKAGTLTTAGAQVKQTAAARAGTLTTAGAQIKQTAISRAGTLTTSGAVTTIQTFTAALAGTLTTAGNQVKQTAISKAGTLTTAGAQVKQTAISKAGTLTTAGTQIKQTAISRAGTLTTAGAQIKQTAISKAGTLTTAGTQVKQTAISRAGTLTSSGALATTKTFVQAIAGTLTTAGTQLKQTAINRAGTLTTAGAQIKQTAISRAGTLTTAGTSIKKTIRAIAGALTSSGILAGLKEQPPTATRNLTLQARSQSLTLQTRS